MVSHENICSLMTCIVRVEGTHLENGSQYTLYCFSFHSELSGAEGGASQVCGPTGVFPLPRYFFFDVGITATVHVTCFIEQRPGAREGFLLRPRGGIPRCFDVPGLV